MRTARRTVATYEYTDENGERLYRVIRTEPKGFRQQRADGTRCLAGVRRVLYRLPHLIEAAALGKAVHICEGERDADTLVALGLTATTVAGGAAALLTAEMAETLRGATAIIHADNDTAGRECAERRGAVLHTVTESVRVIGYPELPEHGGVTDFLASHTATELQTRVDAAPPWAPAAGIRANDAEPSLHTLATAG